MLKKLQSSVWSTLPRNQSCRRDFDAEKTIQVVQGKIEFEDKEKSSVFAVSC